MDIEGWRTVSKLALFAGAALAVLGLIVIFKASTLGGVLLLIAGIAIAAIGGSVSGFLSTYDFHEMVVDASKKKRE